VQSSSWETPSLTHSMLSQQEVSVHEGSVEIGWRLQVAPRERQYL